MTDSVLHVAETVKGGVATVLNQLLKSDVESFCLIPRAQRDSIESSYSSVNYFGGSSRGIVLLIKMMLSSLVLLKKKKPKVVHLHSSFALLLAPIVWVYNKRIKIIYQPHGVFYDSDIPRSKIKIYLIKAIEKTLVLFVHKIVSISNHEKYLIDQLHGHEKVFLLRNAVEPSNLKFDLNRNRDSFLFVGRLDEQKGIDELIKVWRHRDETLHVVGDSVRSDFNKKSLPNIIFHGWVSPKELDGFYANAKAVIVPSRWEGFGLVVIEAFRNGTPVISSERGALPELVHDDLSGYTFVFNKIDKELPVILNKFKDKRDLEIMSQYCFDFYKSEFRVFDYIKKYESLVKELMKT